MQPKLSIITINFNDAVGLEKTIKSVLNQTYKDFEYLIIDGASTDNSVAVIKRNQSNINYWISEKDSGIFNAMNKGISVAKGAYFLFLNSGDVLSSKTALQDFITHPNFVGDIIYGDYQFGDGGKEYPNHLTPLFFVRSSLPHQSTLFHKKVFEEMGMYDEKFKMVSDRAFYIKCFLSNKFVFKHINYPLSVFDLSGISNAASHKQQKIKEDEQMFQEYFGIYYEDYKKLLFLQSEVNRLNRETFLGISKRIVTKIKKICKIR